MFSPQMPAYRRIQDKLRVPLYYIHMATNNRINCKCLRVLIINFYRLVQFLTRRRFHASISVWVSNSDHPVTYSIQLCMKKVGHKTYHCMSARPTQHSTLLHNAMTLHRKTFLCEFSTHARKYHLRQNCHSLHWYTHARLRRHYPLQNMILTIIRVKKFPYFLR